MATKQTDIVRTAYRDWLAVLDKIAQAPAQEQLALLPEARRAYARCRQLDGTKIPPRKDERRVRMIPPRSSRPDDEAVDRAIDAERDRP